MADPQIKASKRPDGFFAWSFTGPLSHPRIAPAVGAMPAPGLGMIPRPAGP
jgi:hypothetical protein